MSSKTFLERVSGLLFREALGQELARAKRHGDCRIIVRHGAEDEIYAHITIGARSPEDSTRCRNHVIVRSDLHRTLNGYVRAEHTHFFDRHNLNENHAADSYFILYRNRLCDLKAMVRVSLDLPPGDRLAQSPNVARAVRRLGFSIVHFIDEQLENSTTIDLKEIAGTERDGLRYGLSGEGENHKELRIWVKDNPAKVVEGLRNVQSKTEVALDSGDRIDVVYCCKGQTIAIEVKSSDSDHHDLRRGVYQCVKYRAVLRAQYSEKNESRVVSSLLITQSELDDNLKKLARKLGIKNKIVSLS